MATRSDPEHGRRVVSDARAALDVAFAKRLATYAEVYAREATIHSEPSESEALADATRLRIWFEAQEGEPGR